MISEPGNRRKKKEKQKCCERFATRISHVYLIFSPNSILLQDKKESRGAESNMLINGRSAILTHS